MKQEIRRTGSIRARGFLITLTVLVGLLLPSTLVAAQTTDDATTQVVAEVPTTGARRPGPTILATTRVVVSEREPDLAPEPVPVEGVAPVALQVDSVGVDAPIELGAVVDGAMQDPSGPWVVSWYDALGKVGEGGNVVMAGHVDYWNVGPAVFWDIRNLPAGEVIRVVGEDGKNYEYGVEWIERYDTATLTPDVIQNDIVGDTGQETLTLITCGGEFDPATGEYNERWVVRANRV